MRARVAKKLLKQALQQRWHIGAVVPGTLLVLQHDASVTLTEAQALADMLHRAMPCTQVLLLNEHIKLVDTQHPQVTQ